MKERENLLDCDGRHFAAIIHGFSARGKVKIEASMAYLCQNKFDMYSSFDKLGYPHSYCVGKGTKEDLINHLVQDLAIYPETAEELEEFYDWHVGDTLMNKEKKTLYRVVFRSGEFVVGASTNTSMGLGHLLGSTRVKLHEEDWRLKVEPPKEKAVEISMSDIRREFGISANEKIIIKD